MLEKFLKNDILYNQTIRINLKILNINFCIENTEVFCGKKSKIPMLL